MKKVAQALVLSVTVLFFVQAFADKSSAPPMGVEVRENQLFLDGEKQPQLFGAELQYFRLRGGYGPNVPRAKVIELWNKALDLMVEAKMNAISFYIPWDFHEYAEGKFDFTGTADEDGDGRPDYPSRDVLTFLRLIGEHGIKTILVRPGPYINAEWGFLGFGAIPEWFHRKFPESHMLSPSGLRTKLYDYHNPDLLRYTELWFQELYTQVLKSKIGPGQPIRFLQLDNETNFMWQSIYNHDYSSSALVRYRDFLKSHYSSLSALNSAEQTSYSNWEEVQAPVQPGLNIAKDQDWYRFQDFSIYSYLQKIRQMWERIGVHEPQVLFTLAESYNATPNGLLPNYIYRNTPGQTGLMTINMYPKTEELPSDPLLNLPFKVDLDVVSAQEANKLYLNKKQDWALGPEVQAGWWKGTDVSLASRQQTYLSAIGHGMKALFLYYFSEGNNFSVEWAHNQVTPLYLELCQEHKIDCESQTSMTDAFWQELQERVNRSLLVGIDAKQAVNQDFEKEKNLYFDSPLDGSAQPRASYYELKKIATKVIDPYKDFLAQSTNVYDDVVFLKDVEAHAPSRESQISSVQAQSEWAGGLLGYFMNEGVNPKIQISEISKPDFSARLFVHLDTGLNSPRTFKILDEALARHKNILNFLSQNSLKKMGFASVEKTSTDKSLAAKEPRVRLSFYLDPKGRLQPKKGSHLQRFEISAPSDFLSAYPASLPPRCEAILYWNEHAVGYRCVRGSSVVVQIGALIFSDYNSSHYSELDDLGPRRTFLRALLDDFQVQPLIKVDPKAARVVAFARHSVKNDLLWLTVKTGTRESQKTTLALSHLLLPKSAGSEFTVTDLLSSHEQALSKSEITSKGFAVHLDGDGSTVFVVRAKTSDRPATQ
jgi:hypothetical protein